MGLGERKNKKGDGSRLWGGQGGVKRRYACRVRGSRVAADPANHGSGPPWRIGGETGGRYPRWRGRSMEAG